MMQKGFRLKIFFNINYSSAIKRLQHIHIMHAIKFIFIFEEFIFII